MLWKTHQRPRIFHINGPMTEAAFLEQWAEVNRGSLDIDLMVYDAFRERSGWLCRVNTVLWNGGLWLPEKLESAKRNRWEERAVYDFAYQRLEIRPDPNISPTEVHWFCYS